MKYRLKTYLTAFFEKVEYPQEARESLLVAFDKIWCDDLKTMIESYAENMQIDYDAFIGRMEEISRRTGVHPYQCNLLLPLCLTPSLEKYYHQKGYPQQVFDTTVQDFRYKMLECKKLHGVWGFCITKWFESILKLKILGFGKLQFVLGDFNDTYKDEEMDLKPETQVLHVHIPMTGTPLDKESKNHAYQEAKKFYQPLFGENKKIPFVCSSWLLFQKHKEFLKPTSNLYAFIEDFKIIKEAEYDDYAETWRLFHTKFTRWEDMPQDTSLQRAYVELIKRGEKTGKATGVFFL
jgi:hypothetical protein